MKGVNSFPPSAKIEDIFLDKTTQKHLVGLQMFFPPSPKVLDVFVNKSTYGHIIKLEMSAGKYLPSSSVITYRNKCEVEARSRPR
jgi:hypothetical protein